ncbi:MAG: ImmA/IrrE family metallo-endopeptidase [Polyangiaceae bacterium]|nr:ImmA/IrrE family metallo-endopeptidase [Polyangiaceae bacterium]
MLATTRQYINALAERVRDALDLGGDDFPVDLISYIPNMGGEFVRTDQAAESMIEKVGSDSFRVTVRRGLHRNRERFSIAHELGHLFLHMGYCIDDQKWDAIDPGRDGPMLRFGYSDQEYEAHEFGAALLMPRDAFRVEVARHQKDGALDLKPIAERFGVSVEAARRRGQWLGMFYWGL